MKQKVIDTINVITFEKYATSLTILNVHTLHIRVCWSAKAKTTMYYQ